MSSRLGPRGRARAFQASVNRPPMYVQSGQGFNQQGEFLGPVFRGIKKAVRTVGRPLVRAGLEGVKSGVSAGIAKRIGGRKVKTACCQKGRALKRSGGALKRSGGTLSRTGRGKRK